MSAVDTRRGVAIIACTNVDVLAREVDEIPAPSTDTFVEEVSVRAAGPGLNAAFVMHALGDGPAVVYSAIGDDPLADMVLSECRARNLPVHGIATRAGQRTGAAIALESRTRPRAFLTDLGAAGTFTDMDLPATYSDCTDVLLGGYFVAPRLRGEPTDRVLRRAREDGARTWLDCGWDTESWRGGARAELLALLPEVDFFLPNTAEVEALTGLVDPVAGGAQLAGLVRCGVIVKAGPDGAYWIERSGETVHISAPATEVVDTTGAGDALNAGVIVGLRRGLSMVESVMLGVRVASAIVGRPSRRRWDRLPH